MQKHEALKNIKTLFQFYIMGVLLLSVFYTGDKLTLEEWFVSSVIFAWFSSLLVDILKNQIEAKKENQK